MPRQRRNDKHHGLIFDLGEGGRIVHKALEATQFAERLLELDALQDGDFDAIFLDSTKAEFGFLVVLDQSVHEVKARRHALRKRRLPHQAQRVGIDLRSSQSQIGKGLHQGALGFV